MRKAIILICAFLSFTSVLYCEEIIDLGKIFTYVDSPKVEEKISLTSDEIQELHVSTLTELLQTQGVQIKSYGGYGNESSPTIRGFTGACINVIVDGVKSNSAQLGTFDFGSINPDSIEKIEIIKSGFNQNVISEGGSGGTIIITTKKENLSHRFGIDFSAKTFFYNPFDTYKLNFDYSGMIFENSFLKTEVGGVFAKNEFPFYVSNNKITKLGEKRIHKNNQVADGKSVIDFSHYFGNGNSWTISENFYISDKNITGTFTSTDISKQNDLNNSLSFGICFPAVLNSVKSESNISWKTTNMKYVSETENSLHLLNSISLNSSATYFALDFYEQSLGISLTEDFLNSTDAGTVTRFSGFVKETSVFKFLNNYSVVVPLSVNFSGKNLSLVPSFGIRADYMYLSVFANGTRLLLFPTLNQLYWNDSVYACGNPDLKPESGWGGELGLEVKNIPVPFAVTLFSNYYENKIQWQSEKGKWIPTNLSSAFYFGVDFSVETKLFEILTLCVDYEFLHNELLAEGITKGKMIMYTPNHVLNVMAKIDLPYTKLVANGHFVSYRYISNLNSAYLDGYFLLDVSAEFYPVKWCTPYIKVNNALNQCYEETEDYPMPGISLEIGAKFSW